MGNYSSSATFFNSTAITNSTVLFPVVTNYSYIISLSGKEAGIYYLYTIATSSTNLTNASKCLFVNNGLGGTISIAETTNIINNFPVSFTGGGASITVSYSSGSSPSINYIRYNIIKVC